MSSSQEGGAGGQIPRRELGPGSTGSTDPVILVVDDEPANLLLLRRILELEGYREVHTLTDPREVLATFEAAHPDLLLLDLHMPHLDGFAVMELLPTVIPEDTFLPLVVLTADATPETRRRALSAGATDFLLKPLDPVEVRLRVRNLLRARGLHLRVEEERRELERRVRERTEDLRRANESLVAANQVKTDFISMASHEMRTPLTVLKGATNMLARRWDEIAPELRGQQFDVMLRNIARLEGLVNNLLVAARIEAHEDEDEQSVRVRGSSVELDALLRNAVQDSDPHPEPVAIECDARRPVRVDTAIAEQIVVNLLTNAAKYGAPPVEVEARLANGDIEITVRDHGEGVPEAFVPRLFDRFTQASVGDRRAAQGTGLGLWVAKGLASLHGGTIAYEPASPGARFRVRLPQVPASAAANA